MANSRKGQAAMEYLMTYGWALLVIVIVAVVLLTLNLKPAEQCIFDEQSIRCDQPQVPVLNSAGNLFATLSNGKTNSINIYTGGIVCTNSKDKPAEPAAAAAVLATIPAGGSIQLTGASATTCIKTSGGAFTTGETYQGKLWIYYKNADDPSSYPYRYTSAQLVAKVS
ncbi:hypothetical protein FJZ26_02030 [Candidatus Parvarchaeota archaeon]|nr:hypothetical protein [Candidatus Parvarchaeota archaeon]